MLSYLPRILFVSFVCFFAVAFRLSLRLLLRLSPCLPCFVSLASALRSISKTYQRSYLTELVVAFFSHPSDALNTHNERTLGSSHGQQKSPTAERVRVFFCCKILFGRNVGDSAEKAPRKCQSDCKSPANTKEPSSGKHRLGRAQQIRGPDCVRDRLLLVKLCAAINLRRMSSD